MGKLMADKKQAILIIAATVVGMSIPLGLTFYNQYIAKPEYKIAVAATETSSVKATFDYLTKNKCYVDAIKNWHTGIRGGSIEYYQYKANLNGTDERQHINFVRQLSADRIVYDFLSHGEEVTYYCAKGDYNIVSPTLFKNQFFFKDIPLSEAAEVLEAAKDKPLKRLEIK